MAALGHEVMVVKRYTGAIERPVRTRVAAIRVGAGFRPSAKADIINEIFEWQF